MKRKLLHTEFVKLKQPTFRDTINELPNNMELGEFIRKWINENPEVAKQAAKEKIKFSQREVKTKFYEGKVMVYPESFLRRYFDEEIELGDEVINDDLPF